MAALVKLYIVCCFIWHHQSPKRKQMTLKRRQIQGDLKYIRLIYCDVGVGGPKGMVH